MEKGILRKRGVSKPYIVSFDTPLYNNVLMFN